MLTKIKDALSKPVYGTITVLHVVVTVVVGVVVYLISRAVKR